MGTVTVTKIDWKEKARLDRLRADNDWPLAEPRIPSCRKCGKDAGAAGWLYCDRHRADMTITELTAAGEHHGGWRIGRNRLDNPTWVREN